MIKLPMPRGEYALISDIDSDLTKYNWSNTGHGYVQARINLRVQRLHIIVIERMIGRKLKKGEQTDHADRNKLNNQRENLRVATSTENHANSSMQTNNTSGYRGVTFHNTKTVVKGKEYSYDYWVATIKKDRKTIFIGKFKTKEEAARAYNKKAKELFGEFSFQNPL